MSSVLFIIYVNDDLLFMVLYLAIVFYSPYIPFCTLRKPSAFSSAVVLHVESLVNPMYVTIHFGIFQMPNFCLFLLTYVEYCVL